MSSLCLNNGFRLQETNRTARHWKQRPKKPFYHVSRDKILHDSWSISAALARGFYDHHFERGEGPGNEVGLCKYCGFPTVPCVPRLCSSRDFIWYTTISHDYAGSSILPPRVLVSGPKPCGGNKFLYQQIYLNFCAIFI